MLQGPLDIALIAGVVLLIFGPRNSSKPPFRLKPETYEHNRNSAIDPFKASPTELLVNNDKRIK